jgi:hypothetical protein
MSVVYVTNKGGPVFEDGFNGAFWTFREGQTHELSERAARHIFGFGVHDKAGHFARLGWMKDSTDLAKAEEILAKFEIGTEPPPPVAKPKKPISAAPGETASSPAA